MSVKLTAIEEQSAKIAAVVWGDTNEVGADPVPPDPAPSPHPFIDAIVAIFSKLLPMLLTCLPALARPARVTRMFNRQLPGHQDDLQRCIDQVCTENDPKGSIKAAFLHVGRTIKVKDVAAMLEEAKSL